MKGTVQSETSNPRFVRGNLRLRVLQRVIDVAICLGAFAAAYAIRFDAAIPAIFVKQLIYFAPMVAVLRLATFSLFGVYGVVWRYVGIREALLFSRAVAAVSVVLLAMRLLLPDHGALFKVPISVIILEGIFTMLGVGASRILRRILDERRKHKESAQAGGVPTLVVGAGRGGLAIAKESLQHPELGIRVVGFIDDDEAKNRMRIHGVQVFGRLDAVDAAVRATAAKQVIISTNAIPSSAILALMDLCRPIPVPVRIVPNLFEILGEPSHAQALREVRIEDLLSRDPIPPSMSMDDLTSIYTGKRILVTGAGGSIGSELCRQLMLLEPEKLFLLERDESNLFEIHRELRRGRVADVAVPVLADITDRKHLSRIFGKLAPHVVFHAAAYKHVPMMERFPLASVANNVFGTKNIVELADEHGVESVLLISTDKAVKPSSVMGATKRLAEMVVQQFAPASETRYSCVRFGNVLGSRSSVVPIFRDQIAKGGPVTVTHPEATRYFMTIPEAANLVLQAATIGVTGEVFLLDMGEPVKIMDLARQMIHLSGATEQQIPIKIIGTRPGEKLYEELRTSAEEIEDTALRKVFLVTPEDCTARRLEDILERLTFSIRAQDPSGIRQTLCDLGIGYEGKPVDATGKQRRSPSPVGRTTDPWIA